MYFQRANAHQSMKTELRKTIEKLLYRKYTYPLHITREEAYQALSGFCVSCTKEGEGTLERLVRINEEHWGRPFMIDNHDKWFCFYAYRHNGGSIEEIMQHPYEKIVDPLLMYIGFFSDDNSHLDLYIVPHIAFVLLEGFFLLVMIHGLLIGDFRQLLKFTGFFVGIHAIFRMMPCKATLKLMKEALGTDVVDCTKTKDV